MWGPSGDGKFLIVAAVAAVVTSFEIWQTYHQAPFRDTKFKALLWWTLVALLDAGAAAVIILLAPDGVGHSASAKAIVAWVAVGIAVPLGMRVPIWGRLGLGRIKVDPGVTLVYDIARGWLRFNVDERMSGLVRRERTRQVAQLHQDGWTPAEILALIEATVRGRVALEPADRERIIGQAQLQVGFATPAEQLGGLLTVVRQERLSTVLDQIRERRSKAADSSAPGTG
jgi:hypothetical protein